MTTSEVAERIRKLAAGRVNQNRQLQDQLGINVETDIDRVVASLGAGGGQPMTNGLLLAHGRFDANKIEAAMLGRGARIEQYSGKRLVVGGPGTVALAFLEPGLIGVGSVGMVRRAIDLGKGGESAVANADLMSAIRSLKDGSAWAVARSDAFSPNMMRIPPAVASQLPAMTWISASVRVDRDVHGMLRAEARDAEAAGNLRDVARGLIAAAKLQGGNRPEFQAAIESLVLESTGKTVTLSFAVPGQAFDAIARR
jgi:hypothetical protein